MLLKKLGMRLIHFCRQVKHSCMLRKNALKNIYLKIQKWIKDEYLDNAVMLYQVIFKRPPSKTEMEILSQFKNHQGKLGQILQNLMNSVEFDNLYFLENINKHPDLCIKEGYKHLLSQSELLGNPLVIWNQPLLVFFHMKKTGGMTIHHWLSQYFHPLQICPERQDNIDRFSENELLNYKFIGAHLTYNQYIKLPHKQKYIVTILREPKKRIVSHYLFCQSHSLEWIKPDIKNRDAYIAAKSLTFCEFLQAKGSLQNIYDNVYLRSLTDSWVKDSIDPLTENPELLLELAKQRLNAFYAVGILEEFNKTIELFCSVLDLAPVKGQNIKSINVLRDMQQDPNNLIFSNREQPELKGNEVNVLLEESTKYDSILYEYGRQIFEKKYAAFISNQHISS